METKTKIIYSEILLFSLIGFLAYLVVIVAGFIASRFGITSAGFNAVLTGVVISGIVSFGVCSYFTCFKNKHVKQHRAVS